MKKYSPSYNAFYETTINDVIPKDAVDITDEKWAALLEGQTQGKVISCGPDMRPCLNEPPLPTSEEVIMQAEVRKNQLRAFADATIQPLQDASDLEMATEDESALLIAWKKYRIQLMRVDTSAGLSIVWPDTPA